MKLPLIPARDEEYTVVEYPSNAQVQKCAKVIIKTEGVPDDQKKQIADEHKIPESEICEELSPNQGDLELARVVFQEDIPAEVSGEDIAPKAVREATENFIGIGDGTNGGLLSILRRLAD